MRGADVIDVNVISNAGSIGRRKIIAIHREGFTLPQRGFQQDRNDPQVRIMVLSQSPIRRATGHVEISQCDAPEGGIRLHEVSEQILDQQLRPAIRIAGPLRRLLVHGQAIGNSIGRTSGAKDESLHSGDFHGLQEMNRARRVVLQVPARMPNRFANITQRREVHDRLDFMLTHHGGQLFRVRQIHLIERRITMDGIPMAPREIVDHDNVLPLLHQLPHAMRANVPRSASDQDPHFFRPLRLLADRNLRWRFGLAPSDPINQGRLQAIDTSFDLEIQ